MAYTGFTQTNPLALPRTIDPSASLSELNPLPPPGRSLDGTVNLHPMRTGHYEAVKHKITVTLTGTYATDDVGTFTVTPVKSGNGVANADGMTAVSFDVVTGATETPTGTAALAPAAALASSTVTTLAAADSSTRLREICTVTASGATVVFEAINPGATFTVAFAHDASGTSTQSITTDAAKANLRVGIFVARDGVAADSKTPKIRLLTNGDTAASIYGIVADGDRAVAIDSDSGYSFQGYRPGRDVPIIPLEGAWTAFAEAAVDAADPIWVRAVATGSEVAGAVNDTPDFVAQVVTLTPTAANTTVYEGAVSVYDSTGVLLASTLYSYSSDGDATAAEIVTGIKVDLEAGAVDDYIAVTGSATAILTALAAGYQIVHVPHNTAGIVRAALTEAGSTDHVLLPKGKFSTTTTAAGVAGIDFGL